MAKQNDLAKSSELNQPRKTTQALKNLLFCAQLFSRATTSLNNWALAEAAYLNSPSLPPELSS